MLLKNLLITTLWLVIPVTVYAAGQLCGSDSAVVENWKGEVIEADEMISTLEEPEELISTAEHDVEPEAATWMPGQIMRMQNNTVTR